MQACLSKSGTPVGCDAAALPSTGLVQGFPDDFSFSGNVHNRHRQIGNAVPPPLAAALGRQLRMALEDKAAKDAEQLMAEQLAALG